MGQTCSTHEEDDRIIRNSIGKPEASILFGRFKLIGQNGFEIYSSELVCADTDCIQLAQITNQWRALLNTVTHFPISYQE